MNILLVDKDCLGRSELSRFFSECGHDVVEAENGREGLVKFYTIGSTYFDIIVTETVLPTLSGIDMADRIKNSYLGSRIPIVAMTSDFENDYRVDNESPFNLILPKDLSNSKLLDFCLLMAKRKRSPMIYREA
ncbi:response regulator [Aquiflexum gelatinilyticum]|jgi:CheY-like chemotaxis protein|uniref:response regulator n=1 Tax=Aquiflexum gelatinilyticum TaxID=2961943 RepID=UPI0021677DFB|nr:response regulator [Aquiflexum gelatinilyticum]MCS4435039.1 response regulator [Aquiflexum gelatinilyticum]